jgi:hypothetical protein
MDDFDNDMGLPDDEIIGEAAGDVNDLGADLESEPDLGGGEPAAISRGSSGGQRQRAAAPAAPKPKAPAKPKAKAKAQAKKKSAPKKKAAAAKKKSKAKPAKKSKGKAKAAKKSKKKAGKKK